MPRDFNSEDELARAEDARVVPLPHLPAPVDPVLGCLIAGKRKIMEPGVWVQNPGSGHKTMCAGLAADRAHYWEPSLPSGYGMAAWRALCDVVPAGFGRCIGAFNDHPSTTHADVLSLFDRAISARSAVLASKGA